MGDQKAIQKIMAKMPKKVKKQRKVKMTEDDNEENVRWDEYYDYIFPGDEGSLKNLKILQKAYNWKNKQKQQ